MANLYIVPQIVNAGGGVANGTAEFYESGTETALNVYSDSAGTVSLGNTINADATGYFTGVYLASGQTYRVRRKVDGVTLDTQDDVNQITTTEVATITALKAYTGPANLVSVLGLNAAGDGGGRTMQWMSGDYSTQVTNAPGFFIAKNSDPTGATGAWVPVINDNKIRGIWWNFTSGAGASGNSALVNEGIYAAEWFGNLYGLGVYVFPVTGGGNPYEYDASFDEIPSNVIIEFDGFYKTQLNLNFDLPVRHYTGDGATTTYAFPFGTSTIDTSLIRVLVWEDDANGIEVLRLKALTTDYTISNITTTSCDIVFTSNLPNGDEARVIVLDKMAVFNFAGQQAQIRGKAVFNRLTGLSTGYVFGCWASETPARDYGDNILIEGQLSGAGTWTGGAALFGTEKVGSGGSPTTGIRQIDITGLQTFQCIDTPLLLSGVQTAIVKGFDHSQTYTAKYDIVVSGDATVNSTHIQIEAVQLNKVLVDYCNGFRLDAGTCAAYYVTSTSQNTLATVASDVPTIQIDGTSDNLLVTNAGVFHDGGGWSITNEKAPTDTNSANVLNFKTGNSTKLYVGNASNTSSDAYIDAVNDGLYLFAHSSKFIHLGAGGKTAKLDTNGFYSTTANVLDIGTASLPCRDGYFQNAITVTSDEREKYDIESIRSWPKEKFDKYLKFILSLDDASFRFRGRKRTHFGVVAQEVEVRAIEAGLDVNDLSFIKKSEVWDEVPVLDDDGNQVVQDIVIKGEVVRSEKLTEHVQRLNDDGTPYLKYGIGQTELNSLKSAIRYIHTDNRLNALEAKAKTKAKNKGKAK